MLNKIQLYYFSPTGGTKTYGEFFCKSAHDFVGAFEKAGRSGLKRESIRKEKPWK